MSKHHCSMEQRGQTLPVSPFSQDGHGPRILLKSRPKILTKIEWKEMVKGYISMRFTGWGTVSRSKVYCSRWKPVLVEFLDITNYYILPCVFTASWHHSPHTNTPDTNPPVSRGKCTPTTSFHDGGSCRGILGCLWFWVWEFPLSSCVLTLLELTIPKPPRPTAKKNAKKTGLRPEMAKTKKKEQHPNIWWTWRVNQLVGRVGLGIWEAIQQQIPLFNRWATGSLSHIADS